MVSFKMFAGTDVGLRDNNEDNFTICPDLLSNEWIMPADHQQVIPLGGCGCLMVVADGMGGQNAGEVASAIAIDTVQKMFAPGCLTDKVISKPATVKDYLRTVISKADLNVKKYSQSHPDAEGLGSTIVIAWVIGDRLYVGWLGDSRAYSYIPGKGIMRLSKDHSYVQQLVDKGRLTEIEAMNHPNSNIITRSLGDMSQKAKADVEEYQLEKGEIILLCSDGLCGVCTDEEIANVLSDESNDLQKCKEHLTDLALDNGGSDNITISLMQLVSVDKSEQDSCPQRRIPLWVKILGPVALLTILLIGILGKGHNTQTDSGQGTTPEDSVQTNEEKTNISNHPKPELNNDTAIVKEDDKVETKQLKTPSGVRTKLDSITKKLSKEDSGALTPSSGVGQGRAEEFITPGK